jgi:threonine 3-dehydrogenase
MAEMMKAVRKTQPGAGAQLTRVPIPAIQPDEVLVKVRATTICGTDVHIYQWNEWSQSRIRNLPQTLGHELAGEVVEVGSTVRTIRPGDLVSCETHIPCGGCVPCMTGQMHICANLQILGVDRDGCFAEYVAVPAVVCWKNDPSIPPEIAAAQEPLGNAVYATLVEPVTARTVLIFGDGPTGLFAVGVARAAGASKVILVGINEARLNIARQMGADLVLHSMKDDVRSIVRDATSGIGADVVLDMVGVQQVIDLGLELVRKGGRFSAFGLPDGRVSIDMNNGIIFKGLRLYGINGRLMFETWLQVSQLLASGRLDIRPVLTHKLPLEDFDRAFSLIAQVPISVGKVVLLP